MASINVTCAIREGNRWILPDTIWVQEWTLGLHVLLRRVPMDADFPCNPSNRQPPALRLLDSVPPCRSSYGDQSLLGGSTPEPSVDRTLPGVRLT